MVGQWLAVMQRWNHNIHYGRQLLGCVPVGAHDGLDIGCGEGWLVRELRQTVPHVVGIDADGFCIAAASASNHQDGIEYLHGDFPTWPPSPRIAGVYPSWSCHLAGRMLWLTWKVLSESYSALIWVSWS